MKTIDQVYTDGQLFSAPMGPSSTPSRPHSSWDKKRIFGKKRKRLSIYNTPAGRRLIQASKNLDNSTSSNQDNTTNAVHETKNRIIDINLLFPKLESCLCCQKCHGRVKISESQACGLGFKIDLTCLNCPQKIVLSSSRLVGPTNSMYEVNRSSVLATRLMGHEHAGLSAFCEVMDLPQPIMRKDFVNISKQLHKLCESVLEEDGIATEGVEDLTLEAVEPADVSSDGGAKKGDVSAVESELDASVTAIVKEEIDIVESKLDVPVTNDMKEEVGASSVESELDTSVTPIVKEEVDLN